MEKSIFTKQWIIQEGLPIVKTYNGNLTLRALHYRLVAKGMTNDTNHYKKVIGAMTEARWENMVEFDAFKDHERTTLGETSFVTSNVEDSVDIAKRQIRLWANNYSKNRWENQPIYPEVLIEKKALQGVFEEPCEKWNVALTPCKGYPSLTLVYDIKKRLNIALERGKYPVILYFGDYDPSGENIPETIVNNLRRMGCDGFDLRRIALKEEQVIEWDLPPAPTKDTDTRSIKWNGLGQVELDAVEPKKLVTLIKDAIMDVFDDELYDKLLETENIEEQEFKSILLNDFRTLLD